MPGCVPEAVVVNDFQTFYVSLSNKIIAVTGVYCNDIGRPLVDGDVF